MTGDLIDIDGSLPWNCFSLTPGIVHIHGSPSPSKAFASNVGAPGWILDSMAHAWPYPGHILLLVVWVQKQRQKGRDPIQLFPLYNPVIQGKLSNLSKALVEMCMFKMGTLFYILYELRTESK